MARTPSVSDDEILEAAKQVLYTRGPEAFTLAEVATRVGLSRAAIILRFKSTEELKLTLLRKMVDQFLVQLQELPKTASGESLLEIAGFIGRRLGSRANLASFLNTQLSNMDQPVLAELELRRGEAWHQAISRAMPPIAISHEAAVAAFSAHLSGTMLAWPGENVEPSLDFMHRRTREWLQLAGISCQNNSGAETGTTTPTETLEE